MTLQESTKILHSGGRRLLALRLRHHHGWGGGLVVGAVGWRGIVVEGGGEGLYEGDRSVDGANAAWCEAILEPANKA